MPYRIGEECNMCAICAQECPAHAIKEDDIMYRIDVSKCTECGICEEVCPMGAVTKYD